MSDDNGDLGIALTSARAANRRLSEKNGLQRQYHWSDALLNERIAVYLFALCFLALIFFWVADFSTIQRLVATIVFFLLGVTMIVLSYQRKRRMQRQRELQASSVEHPR